MQPYTEVLESQKELQALVDAKCEELFAAATERDAALKVVGTIKHVEVDISAKLDDFKLASKVGGAVQLTNAVVD